MLRTLERPAGAVAALAVLIAGVAGGLAGSAGAASGTQTTAAGAAAARQALLARRDLGRGWTTSAPAPKRVAPMTCPGFNPSLQGISQIGAAVTPTYGRSSAGPFVSQTAYTYATPSQQRVVWQQVARAGLLSCVAASLAGGSGQGVKFKVTGKHVLGLPRLAASAMGYRVSGTATQPYQTINVYLDVLLLGRGQRVTELSLTSLEQPASRSLELRLARIVAGRLSGA
jgi:hypothetical protein